MLEFMRAGGALMWPLLTLGVFAVVASARQALAADPEMTRPLRLASAVLTGGLALSALGLFVVSKHAAGAPGEILVVGIGEALCPTVLGLGTYALVSMITALSRGQRLTQV